jgi:hypothetical protein
MNQEERGVWEYGRRGGRMNDPAGLMMAKASETPFYGVLLSSASDSSQRGRRTKAGVRLKSDFT